MTAPTWPPEVVEAVWDELDTLSCSGQSLDLMTAKLLNRIAKAGEGTVAVRAPFHHDPSMIHKSYVTPAPLEER